MSNQKQYLDPSDKDNWDALSKQYPHLREWNERDVGKSSLEARNIDFPSTEKVEYLKSEDGLRNLNSAWTVAINQFSKLDEARFINAKGWESTMTIAGLIATSEDHSEISGIEFNLESLPVNLRYKYFFEPQNLSEEQKDQVIAHKQDPKNYHVDQWELTFLTITFKIAIRSREMAKQFDEVSKNLKLSQRLADYIWTALKNIIPWISSSESQAGTDLDGNDVTYEKSFEDQFEGVTYRIEKVQSVSELNRLCGMSFEDLLGRGGTLKPLPVRKDTGGGKSEYIHENLDTNIQGKNTNKVEKIFTDVLRGEGYLVVLEPDLFIPEPEIKASYRKPDLLVFYRGNCLAVEIDDMSHVKEVETGKFNWTKYQRDEDLRAYLLASGIPMIRIWHHIVRDNPYVALGKVANSFKNIW